MTVSDGDLEALLAQVATGDRDALAMLYDLTVEHVFHQVRAVVLHADHVEEMVLAVYSDVWVGAAQRVHDGGGVLPWLNTLACRHVLDGTRSESAYD